MTTHLSNASMVSTRCHHSPKADHCDFVTFKGGLIVNDRESWNPLAVMEAMSGSSFQTDVTANLPG